MKTIELSIQQKREFDRVRRTKQAIKLLEDREETAIENIKGEFQGDCEFHFNGRKAYSITEQPKTSFDRKAFLAKYPHLCEKIGEFITEETIRVFRCH